MPNGINATSLEEPKNRFDINVGKDTRSGIAELLMEDLSSKLMKKYKKNEEGRQYSSRY